MAGGSADAAGALLAAATLWGCPPSDPRVAACIVTEATGAGVCSLEQRGRPPMAGLGGDATRAPAGQKVL